MPYTKQETDAYVKIRARIVGTRILLALFVGVIFTMLKLFGALTWSWWWVTAPWWGSAAYLAVALLGIALFGAANTVKPLTVSAPASVEKKLSVVKEP